MYKFSNVDKILLVLIVAIGFGCTAPKKEGLEVIWRSAPKKEGLEVIWEESQRPFWTLLKNVSLSYDEKISLWKDYEFNAYGTVTFINHYASAVEFETRQEMLNVTFTYYLSDNEGSTNSFTYNTNPPKMQTQRLVPGDTARFYLLFHRVVKIRERPGMVWYPESIDNVLDYKLEDSQKAKGYSARYLNLVLKKMPDQSYAMNCRGADKYFYSSKLKDKLEKKLPASSGLLAKDFPDFAANFPDLTFQGSYDLPQFPKYNEAPDFAKMIPASYMKQFVRQNLRTRSAEDTLIRFAKKSELQKMNGEYVGKIKHANEHEVAVLLIKLSDSTLYYTENKKNAYYMLGYYRATTGEALGYDLVSGFRRDLQYQTLQSRLHLRNGQLIIERIFNDDRDPRNHGQKYTVDIGHTPKIMIQKKHSNKVTLPLTGEAKVKQGIQYKTHCNKQLNYCVDLPFDILVCATRSAEEGTNDDTFASKNGELSMYVADKLIAGVFGKSDKANLVGYYNYLKKNYSDNPSNKYYLGKGFVTSKTTYKDDIIIYRKYMVKQSSLIQIGLIYPKSKAQHYEKIIQQIFTSFK